MVALGGRVQGTRRGIAMGCKETSCGDIFTVLNMGMVSCVYTYAKTCLLYMLYVCCLLYQLCLNKAVLKVKEKIFHDIVSGTRYIPLP